VPGELGAESGELQNVARALAADNIHGTAQDWEGGRRKARRRGSGRAGGATDGQAGARQPSERLEAHSRARSSKLGHGLLQGKAEGTKTESERALGREKGVKKAANWGLTCGR
jgi:hypothetical protein